MGPVLGEGGEASGGFPCTAIFGLGGSSLLRSSQSTQLLWDEDCLPWVDGIN